MHTINKREKSQKYHKCRDFQNQRTNQQSSLNKESGSISGMVTVEDHKTTKKKRTRDQNQAARVSCWAGARVQACFCSTQKHSIHKQNTHNKNPKNQRLKDWALGPGI